tara:strand:- start:30 stop:197 length:168 start_codon:yes stop_codon:yes gene_type:complete
MTDYLDIKERKDVTVKNMFKIYKSDDKYRNRITWDTFYLITGWKHIQHTKNDKQK